MARERIKARRFAVVRLAVRLVSSTQSATAVEYALVLGLIIGVVATGAVLVGRQLDRTMARVAPGDTDAGGADRVPDAPSRPTPAASAFGTPEDDAPTASLVDRYCGHALAVAFGGLVLALVAAGLAHRHRKRPAATADEEPPEEEPQNPSVQMRLYAKRQRLWRALLTDSDLLLKNRIEVRHLMTRELTIVAPRARLAEMNELATSNRVHHLLVCDGGGCLLGVISDRDLRGSAGGTARQLMTPDPKCVSPNTTLSAAITCLIEEGISCLPVVDSRRLCGVLTTTDLVLTLQCALAVVLPHTAPDGARVFCRRLQDRVRNDGRLGPDPVIRAGLSTAVQGDDSAALLTRAEAALTRAQSTRGVSIQDDTEQGLEPAGCAAGD